MACPVSFRRPVDVIEPAEGKPLDAPREALRAALRDPIDARPLGEIAASGDQVVIVISDITRPAPNRATVSALLGELRTCRPSRSRC